MKRGTLVRFTVSIYSSWGLGILLGEKPMVDREGRNHRGFYHVLTQCGVKLVSEEFFERLSWDV